LALKKQGLHYDSIKNEIVKLNDSTRKSSILPPLLRIRDLAITDTIQKLNRYTFSYEIISDGAASYNTHLSFDIFGFNTNGNIVAIDFNKVALYKGQKIAKDQRLTGYLPLIVNFNIVTYAFRLKGYYYSSNKTKIPIDDFYLLQAQNKKTIFQLPVQFHETALREYISINKF
jgi:hypothetical protein